MKRNDQTRAVNLETICNSLGILKIKNTKINLKILEIFWVKLDRKTKRLIYYTLRNSKNCLRNDFWKMAVGAGRAWFFCWIKPPFIVGSPRVWDPKITGFLVSWLLKPSFFIWSSHQYLILNLLDLLEIILEFNFLQLLSF